MVRFLEYYTKIEKQKYKVFKGYFIFIIITDMFLDTFLTFIKNGIIIVLLNDYFKRNYSQEYENVFVTVSLKLIYLYSKNQIYFKRYYLNVYKMIETNPNVENFTNNILYPIMDKIYTKSTTRNTIHKVKYQEMQMKYYTDDTASYFEEEPDCIYIYSDNTNVCSNKVIMHKPPFHSNYEVSNIKFILFELIYNNTSFKINLKSEEYNYYIVNNIIDKHFLIYYLTHHLSRGNLTKEEIPKTDSFSVKLIDQDANSREIEISNNNFIIIKKDTYIY